MTRPVGRTASHALPSRTRVYPAETDNIQKRTVIIIRKRRESCTISWWTIWLIITPERLARIINRSGHKISSFIIVPNCQGTIMIPYRIVNKPARRDENLLYPNAKPRIAPSTTTVWTISKCVVHSVAERRVAPVSNVAINNNIAGKSHHLLREKSIFIFSLLYMCL